MNVKVQRKLKDTTQGFIQEEFVLGGGGLCEW